MKRFSVFFLFFFFVFFQKGTTPTFFFLAAGAQFSSRLWGVNVCGWYLYGWMAGWMDGWMDGGRGRAVELEHCRRVVCESAVRTRAARGEGEVTAGRRAQRAWSRLRLRKRADRCTSARPARGANSAHSAAPLKCEITVSITQPCSDVMCTGMFLSAAAADEEDEDEDDADET